MATLLPDDDPLAEAVLQVERAQYSDSNDDEISALHTALDLALARAGVEVRDLTDDEIEELEDA